MRTTPLVGSKPWFGPRRFDGWGWSPVSWEGWIATVAWVGLMLGASVLPDGWPQALGVVVGAGGLLATTALRGTSPGDSADAEPSVVEAVERLRRRQSPDEP